ncbi:MAG TPA: TonB-dependent receptor [Candidatus Elarobacter sp.]|nr:TonB-dependent receptor [Candidatus Elarobacter sp.]
MAKITVSAALACAFAVLAPAVPPALAAPEATATAPARANAEALKAEIKALKAQRAQPGADVQAIDARLTALEKQLARVDPAAKTTPAGAAPGSGSSGPTVEGGSVATKTTIGRDELQSSNAQNTYDAIKNVPGVAQADAKAGGGADNLQIRGIHLNSTTGYRLDGALPINNNVIMSTEDKERVQVLKGAGALEYGLASPAGIINYVLKRATNRPINEVSFAANGFGQAISGVDVGRKFGNRNQFGFRVNLAGGETGGYARDTGGTRWVGAMTADYTTDNARLRLAYEKFGMNIVENSSLLQNKAGADGRIVLPRIPDPTSLLSGDWARSVGGGQNVALRADVRVNDAATVSLDLGRSDAYRDHRDVSQIGAYNVVTGKGTETVTLIRDQRYTNTYANLATTFKAQHGDFFSNAFTLGYTRNERLANNPVNPSVTFKQNIYNPVMEPAPVAPTGPVQYQPQNSRDYDYYFMDSVTFARRVHITGGLREINYTADDTTATKKVNHSTTSFLAPALGTIVDLSRNVSLYGSYVKSLEESPTAPINAKNAFAVLPPAPATQKEIGVRTTGPKGFAASLAWFTIDRANATTDPVTNIFGLNGTTTFTGIESTLNVPVAPRLVFQAGGQYMNATQHAPNDPTVNGKIPENSPRLSGNVGLAYAPAFAPGLQLSGGLQSSGEREINPQDQAIIPGVTLTNFGMTYSKLIGDRRVVFNLNCRNCGNKRYWSSAVNGALGVGAPRTVSFSVRFAGSP